MSLHGDEGGYERHLPALYQGDSFWGRFLEPFERILSAGATIDGAPVAGIEQTIDRLHQYFVPKADSVSLPLQQAPKDFLDWLAAWVGLSLREDWQEDTQRELIRVIGSKYPKRGTRAGIQEIADLYLQAGTLSPPVVTIVEAVPFQVGVHSTVGVDTWIGGDAPHHFTVRVDFATITPATLDLRPRAVTDIVDREKPAHTYYDLEVLIPTMRVGVRSTVGQDTVLGNKLV